MRYTNTYNLPATLYNAITNDDYSKGDSEFSVTELITHPRIVLLQRLNREHIVVDISDRIPSLLGKTLHKICEDNAKDGEITEERFFATVNGVKISGQVDLQIPQGDGTWEINDYKLTSVYSVMSEKIEWEQQLNIYDYLAHLNGREVSAMKIIAIMKDWQRKMAAVKAGYPVAQVVVVPIRKWSRAEQKAFVEKRVDIHIRAKAAVDGSVPLDYCSDSDRWIRDTKWALMKEGRSSAVKLYDNQESAERDLAAGAGDRIDYRPGTPTRCDGDYCLVSRWCSQYQRPSPPPDQSDRG